MDRIGIVALAGVLGAAWAQAGVVLQVEQNGVFGGGATRDVEVAAEGSRLRLSDAATRRVTFVDRGTREVLEVDLPTRRAVARPFAAYSHVREERAERRAAQLERARARRAEADDAERAELDRGLRELGLRLDGSEELRVERGAPELRHLLLGPLPQPVPVVPLTVWLNEATEPVARLWVAEHLALAVDPLAFYLELGVLPGPLSAVLGGLEGTVVAGELVLDDGALKKRVRFRVVQVREGVALGDLPPPSGLTRVASLDPPQDAAPARACAQCGGPLNAEQVTLSGIPFCSRAHRAAYARAHAGGRH
ncbi:MAG: hypothetical protein R3F62_04935 [Planctomycetota bacterium]